MMGEVFTEFVQVRHDGSMCPEWNRKCVGVVQVLFQGKEYLFLFDAVFLLTCDFLLL